jgi:GNAT superfamily N-acetyltransferase
MITKDSKYQHLAEGFPVGMRFHSAPVIRLADAKPVHLGHVARADGAWRVYIFADRSHPTIAGSRARGLCEFLASDASPLHRFTPPGSEPDAVIDVRATFQQGHRELDVDEMPAVLLPRKGKFDLIDYEKVFCPEPGADDIFDLREVDRDNGCIVVVRPDQYVSHVLPLDQHEALAEFFAGVLIEARMGMSRLRNAGAGEARSLEGLQRRSSDVWDAYRAQLAANPDAIELPQSFIDHGWVRVAAADDGAPIGFSVVIPTDEHVHELDGLFVEPGRMRGGVGRALVEDAAARAAAAGAERLEVTAGPAQGFYEKVGFEVVGAADTRFGPAVRRRRRLRD